MGRPAVNKKNTGISVFAHIPTESQTCQSTIFLFTQFLATFSRIMFVLRLIFYHLAGNCMVMCMGMLTGMMVMKMDDDSTE